MTLKDYAVSYFEALIAHMIVLGFLYFLYALYAGNSPLAYYVLYLCLVSAIGGPVGVLLNVRKHK